MYMQMLLDPGWPFQSLPVVKRNWYCTQHQRFILEKEFFITHYTFIHGNSTDQKKEMFKIAKQITKEKKDVTEAKFTKDERGGIKVDETEILARHKRYFRKLLIEEND